MKPIIRAASLFAAFLAPALASAQTISTVGITVLTIINGVLVPILFALAFIVFLYGVVKTYIFSTGDSAGVETGHKLILWGIIGFAVMISLWGLVNVVANTFGLAGTTLQSLPSSPPSPLYGPAY